MVTESANRGKYAEGKVKDYLNKLNYSGAVAFYRFPDARSGSFQQALSDFLIMFCGRATLLEVKEVNHSYRLPAANYKLQQRAKARSFQAAGAIPLVLIYHTPDKLWRILHNDFFGNLDSGSWDLRGVPTHESCDLALRSFNI